MDPSPGNIAPSWPVAIAHGIRNTTNPMIHQPNADGPADWTTAELVMNKTIATKIATMSNVVSTLGRMPPATRSEISVPESASAAVMATPQRALSRRRSTHLAHPGHVGRACWYRAETAGRPRHGDRTRSHRGRGDHSRHHREPPQGLRRHRGPVR